MAAWTARPSASACGRASATRSIRSQPTPSFRPRRSLKRTGPCTSSRPTAGLTSSTCARRSRGVDMLLLWGATTSRTLRAVWALHELSLDYVAHPILPRTGETKTPEFTRINPRQKIPVLQDGDFTIAESPAIIASLSDTYGTDDTS